MRLAAIYIEDHDYLFNKPQTMNFGGQYFYKFQNNDNNIIINRTLNDKFIPDFFKLVDTKSKVTNLIAIVGQNGAGKSTLLDIIRSEFIDNRYALPESSSLFLVEIDNEYPVILRNDFGKVTLYEVIGDKTVEIELKNSTTISPQTIYYSPHYDYKYNPNFDDVDNHDLSFDKIVEIDLKDIQEKDTNENGWHYSASQELLFKNSIRQIHFLSSDLVRKRNIFKELFDLQEHYEPILYFRGYKTKEKDWNTPDQLRAILKKLEDKLNDEISEWHTIRKFEGDKVVNQVEVNKYLLKRNVIKCIISILHRQMERRNSFLREGFFPYDELEEQINSASAYETFLLFVKHSGIQISSTKPRKILSESIVKSLLEIIYAAIDKAITVDSVSNSTLKTSSEDAINILQLQRQFLLELNTYYSKFIKDEVVFDERDRIEEFINYMPFFRRLSSGEGALLNFYSRIYYFLTSNLKELKFRKLSKHYILLLDEADLTFHITWKKNIQKLYY